MGLGIGLRQVCFQSKAEGAIPMILASTSALGWLIRIGAQCLLFTFVRTMAKGSNPVKAYCGALVFSVGMAVRSWASLGTHEEPWGTDDSTTVRDFKPSNEESLQAALLTFCLVAVATVLGVRAGLSSAFPIRISTPVSNQLARSSGNPLLDRIKRASTAQSEKNIREELQNLVRISNIADLHIHSTGGTNAEDQKAMLEQQEKLLRELYGPIPLAVVKAEFIDPLMGSPDLGRVAQIAIMHVFNTALEKIPQ